MTSKNKITQYITNDKLLADDFKFKATKHPAPKKKWYVTNKLSKCIELELTPTKMRFMKTDNMSTTTNKVGKVTEDGKEDFPLFCPVTWKNKLGNRSTDAVETINAFVMDLDGLDENTARNVFQRLDGICYTAFSSYSQGLKTGYTFRLILPVSRPILLEEYQSVWFTMQKFFPENDIQTKDPARFWFFPCYRADREDNKWRKQGDGGVIDVDKVVKSYAPKYPNANRPKPVPVNTSTPVSVDYPIAPSTGQRYKTLTVPANYPVVGHDGHSHPFDWYIDQWPNLHKRKDKYQCYAPGSGTLGSAFISKSTNLWGVARYRLTCVNDRKAHLDCIVSDNGLELQFSDHGKEWRYLKSVDNIVEMIHSLDLDLWKCEIRQRIFSRDVPVTDVTELRVMNDIRKKFYTGRTVELKMVQQAISLHAEERLCNPLVDYLNELEWDGIERIDGTLHKYMKCEDTRLNKIYSKKWMIAAVARALSPGCKVDTMLVIKAPQGHGKGTFFKTLAGNCSITGYSWFNSSPINIGHKDGQSILRTAWLHEMAELSAMQKKDANVIKNFLSDDTDTFRRAYDKYEVKVPRSSLCLGSANDDDVAIFRDKTGSRRYWFVNCEGQMDHMSFDASELEAEREQLWAEAVHAFKSGEQWWLTPGEQQMSREKNESHTVTGIHETLVQEFVHNNAGKYFLISVMIEAVYNGRTIKPVTYPNYYPTLLAHLGCRLENNGKRCRRNGKNSAGWYYAPPNDDKSLF